MAARQQRRTRVTPAAVRWPERDITKHTLEHFGKFFATLRMPDGAGRRVLQDFQLAILEDYFATYEEGPDGVQVLVREGFFQSLLLQPTGMGKSTLMAALALHHGTYVRSDPMVYVVGGLGEQAKNTMQAAGGFITRSPDLGKWWKSTRYGLGTILSLHPEDTQDAGIHASSAGRRVAGRAGGSQEGKAPTLLLVEELHRHEDNGGAVATMISKVQKRSGPMQVQVVVATTAGDSLDSPLGRMVAQATDSGQGAEVRCTEAFARASKGDVGAVDPDLRPGEFYRRAVDGDGDLVMHEWTLPEPIQPPAKGAPREELDAYLANVKRANPADMVTIRSLRLTFRSLSGTVWVFLRQNANQWVTQDFAAIDRFGWSKCRQPGLLLPTQRELRKVAAELREARNRSAASEALRVYAGLDTAGRWDRTAIVPVWVDPETRRPRTAGAQVLGSTAPGAQRRARNAIDRLELMREAWPGLVIVFDRNYGGGLIAEQFEEDHGLDVVDFNQAGAPMELASMLLAELVDQGGIEHDGNPDLTAHVLSAVMRRSRYGKRWRLEQPRDGRPVDAAAALAMAAYTALNPPEPVRPKVDIAEYRIRGL